MVKDANGYDVKVPSQGQVNFNSVGAAGGIGWIAEKAGILGNGYGGGLFNWGNRNGYGCASPADMPVTRYEMAMQNELAQKDSKIALLEANIFTDGKIADVFERLSARIGAAEAVLAQQAIQNQGFKDAFREVQKDIDYKVNLEAERRECADCKIVNYSNSTFATKLIQPYAAGTEAGTPASTYNPLACGQCGC